MPTDATHLISQLLVAAAEGDDSANQRLWDLVYQELHQIALAQMAREAPGRTLQPTALVNEAYLRLFANGDGSFENRRHFFTAAARAMHRICVDDARRRKRLKRGGGVAIIKADEEPAVYDHDPVEVLAIDEAMAKLGDEAPDLAELVRLRYFVGLNLDETAEILGIARRTVVNRWRLARAFLHGALADHDPEDRLSTDVDESVETN